MVDKNHNGIPDDREVKNKVSNRVSNYVGGGNFGSPAPSGSRGRKGGGSFDAPAPSVNNSRQVSNYALGNSASATKANGLAPANAGPNYSMAYGTPYGASDNAKFWQAQVANKPANNTVGVDLSNPNLGKHTKPTGNLMDEVTRLLSGYDTQDQGAPEDPGKTFLDYLNAAKGLFGFEGVNYDPQRTTARNNATEADGRLEAMYRQLRGSIDADAPVLQNAYSSAGSQIGADAAAAQGNMQQASNVADDRNQGVLSALGINEAAGNIVQNGQDVNTQTAGNIADTAARAQAGQEQMSSNGATAVMNNTNVGNAAGLEGNLQRAANQTALQNLLSKIDMQEQQDNQAAKQQSFANLMAYANADSGYDRDTENREDSVQQNAISMNNEMRQAELQNQVDMVTANGKNQPAPSATDSFLEFLQMLQTQGYSTKNPNDVFAQYKSFNS